MPTDSPFLRLGPDATDGRLPADALIIDMPAGIETKDSLFDVLSDRLKLPAWFGRNWDALEECLRTLDWLDSPRSVVFRHADVPFARRPSQRRTYLDVLWSAASSWRPGDAHQLIVTFPTSASATVRAARRRNTR